MTIKTARNTGKPIFDPHFVPEWIFRGGDKLGSCMNFSNALLRTIRCVQ